MKGGWSVSRSKVILKRWSQNADVRVDKFINISELDHHLGKKTQSRFFPPFFLVAPFRWVQLLICYVDMCASWHFNCMSVITSHTVVRIHYYCNINPRVEFFLCLKTNLIHNLNLCRSTDWNAIIPSVWMWPCKCKPFSVCTLLLSWRLI